MNGLRRLCALAAIALLAACGGQNSSTTTIIDRTPPPTLAAWPASTDNFVPVIVDGGPAGVNSVNTPYITVYLCAPGSTTDCQKIDHVLVDTGSYGFRVMKSKLASALVLPQVANANSNPVFECTPFVSGFLWGAVKTGDLRVGGELAAGLPVQIIDDSGSATVPTGCSTPNGTAGANLGSVSQFGANGVLGIGVFIEDCGPACVASNPPNYYYACPTSTTCTITSLAAGSQVANPIAHFASANFNGSALQMPAIPSAGAASPAGVLTFGINTLGNNMLGTATILTVDPALGYFSTTFQGAAYPSSYIDSGSNAIYLPDPASLPTCSATKGFLCPSGTLALSATNVGTNAVSSTVNFTLVAADILLSNTSYTAFNDLGASSGAAGFGSNTKSFDWGFPFFYGRSVFTAIEQTTVSGITATPPFNAY